MAAPVNSVLPAVSGVPVVGHTLTTSTGTWSGTPTSYTYQWIRYTSAGALLGNIAGATAGSYVLTATDATLKVQAQVTAINGDGPTVAVSSLTGVIGVASGNASYLSQMRDRARSAADCVNDAHITDTELTQWINNGLAELHDLFVAAYDEILTVVTGTGTGDISVVSGTSSYALPSDFYKMVGVDYLYGTLPYRFTMSRFTPRERNRYQGPFAPYIVGRMINGVLVPEYRVRGRYIDLIPQPTQLMGNGKMRLYYIKQFANLVNDTDLVDASIPNGWEEFAVLSAAVCCLIKQERDPAALMSQRQKIEERVRQEAEDIDIGEPMRVTDIRRMW